MTLRGFGASVVLPQEAHDLLGVHQPVDLGDLPRHALVPQDRWIIVLRLARGVLAVVGLDRLDADGHPRIGLAPHAPVGSFDPHLSVLLALLVDLADAGGVPERRLAAGASPGWSCSVRTPLVATAEALAGPTHDLPERGHSVAAALDHRLLSVLSKDLLHPAVEREEIGCREVDLATLQRARTAPLVDGEPSTAAAWIHVNRDRNVLRVVVVLPDGDGAPGSTNDRSSNYGHELPPFVDERVNRHRLQLADERRRELPSGPNDLDGAVLGPNDLDLLGDVDL